MSAVVYAEVEIDSPGGCPVAVASNRVNGVAGEVFRTIPGDDGRITEEFAVDGDPKEAELSSSTDAEVTTITTDTDRTRYRFERAERDDCACEAIERLGIPVTNVQARDGNLRVSFRTTDSSSVRQVIATLRDRFEGVRLLRLTQTDDPNGDAAMPDSRLTDRQREVIRRAHEMGYFEYPRGASAEDVAEELGIARSTFSEHLAAAQSKLVGSTVDAEPVT